jgi:hypothetical protein
MSKLWLMSETLVSRASWVSPIPQKLTLDLLELNLNFRVANDESHKLYLDASDIYTVQINPLVQYDSIVTANLLSFPTAF